MQVALPSENRPAHVFASHEGAGDGQGGFGGGSIDSGNTK